MDSRDWKRYTCGNKLRRKKMTTSFQIADRAIFLSERIVTLSKLNVFSTIYGDQLISVKDEFVSIQVSNPWIEGLKILVVGPNGGSYYIVDYINKFSYGGELS
jgi:hypothetical protein